VFVKNNPGIHFRGVCNSLGLSVGVVQYRLGVLEQAGLVTAYSDGQNKRYFETKVYTAAEVTLISFLRHETTAKILWILAENSVVLHRDIAQSIGLSSQALTWQMNQLKKIGLINAEREGVNVKYSLNEATANALRHLINSNDGSKM
jgi:predicted transcriptional regulator